MGTHTTRRPRFDLSRILVIDLEATCWSGDPPPGETPEIIEIGNAILHTADLHVEPGPEILVQPIRSSVSEFCTELTTLTPQVLREKGVGFPRALDALLEAHGELKGTVWASYGQYDRTMLTAECERRRIEFPFSDTHLNVKRLVALMGGWARETGMMRAMRRVGVEPTPGSTHHRGADDAVNIARLLAVVLASSRERPSGRSTQPRSRWAGKAV